MRRILCPGTPFLAWVAIAFVLCTVGVVSAQEVEDQSGLAALPLHRVLAHAATAMENERYDDAIRYFDHARRERPGDPAIPYNMGIASYRLGLFEQAASLFSIAGAMSDNAELRSKAHVNEGTSRYQQSLEMQGEMNPDALPIDPEEQEKLKAELGASIEHLKESIRKYRAALGEDPTAESARANAELAARRIRQAQEMIEKIEQMQQRQQQQQQQGDDEEDSGEQEENNDGEENQQGEDQQGPEDPNQGQSDQQQNRDSEDQQGQSEDDPQDQQQQQQQPPDQNQQQDPQDADQQAPTGGEQNQDQQQGEDQQGQAMQGDGSTGDGQAEAQSNAQATEDDQQQQDGEQAEGQQDNEYELSQDELDRWLQFAREQERRRQQQQAELRKRRRPRVRKDW